MLAKKNISIIVCVFVCLFVFFNVCVFICLYVSVCCCFSNEKRKKKQFTISFRFYCIFYSLTAYPSVHNFFLKFINLFNRLRLRMNCPNIFVLTTNRNHTKHGYSIRAFFDICEVSSSSSSSESPS